jgi:hypothetical protein
VLNYYSQETIKINRDREKSQNSAPLLPVFSDLIFLKTGSTVQMKIRKSLYGKMSGLTGYNPRLPD